MYLHVGNNRNIRTKNIIGIFDTDNASLSADTRKYLVEAEKEGMLEAASAEIPKSFIIYADSVSDFADRGKYKICFSQLSSSALLGRINGDFE